MYLPSPFAETRPAVLGELIAAYPLGTWVTQQPVQQLTQQTTQHLSPHNSAATTELCAEHIPFLLDTSRGEFGVLMGHVARANPVWKTAGGAESLVVFQGAQAYISPSWYPSKVGNGKAVPTWNYVTVHAHGTAQVIDDPVWLRAFLDKLSNTHENKTHATTRSVPWRMDDAPGDYLQSMIAAVVGIEIPVSRMVGKWKVSQNRPAADQAAIAAQLLAIGGQANDVGVNLATQMAHLVALHKPNTKPNVKPAAQPQHTPPAGNP